MYWKLLRKEKKEGKQTNNCGTSALPSPFFFRTPRMSEVITFFVLITYFQHPLADEMKFLIGLSF